VVPPLTNIEGVVCLSVDLELHFWRRKGERPPVRPSACAAPWPGRSCCAGPASEGPASSWPKTTGHEEEKKKPHIPTHQESELCLASS